MKKILSFILIIALLVIPFQTAFASAIDYTVSYDVEKDSFSVTGTVSASRANIPLTLLISGSDGTVVGGYETVAVRNKKYDIVFDFGEVMLPYTAKEDVYKFIVSAEGYTTDEIKTSSYLSVDAKRLFLEDINTLIESGGDGLWEKMKSKTDEFDISKTELEALDETAQEMLEAQMSKNTYTLPDKSETDSEIEAVLSAGREYKKNADIAIAVSAFSNIKDNTMLKAWHDRYCTAISLDKDDAQTKENEAEIYEYVKHILSSDTFIKRISDCDKVTSIEDLKAKFYESVLLSAVETLHYGTTYTIMTTFPSLFDIDTQGFSRLSSSEKGSVYEAVANQHYESYDKLVDAFDKKVDDLLGVPEDDDDDDDDDGNWSGTRNRGSSVSVGGQKVQPISKVFNDISDVPWAKEAIDYLSNKKIINGKSENIFAPNDYITRAEFIKILVGAMGNTDISGKASFTDVDSSAWYGPYVAVAEKLGIVLGNDSNEFRPNDKITRQDMATILYRAFEVKSTGEAVLFADASDISGYALEAVNALSAAKVINGTGNNMFSPRSSATRAQAAVMIYNIIK